MLIQRVVVVVTMENLAKSSTSFLLEYMKGVCKERAVARVAEIDGVL